MDGGKPLNRVYFTCHIYTAAVLTQYFSMICLCDGLLFADFWRYWPSSFWSEQSHLIGWYRVERLVPVCECMLQLHRNSVVTTANSDSIIDNNTENHYYACVVQRWQGSCRAPRAQLCLGNRIHQLKSLRATKQLLLIQHNNIVIHNSQWPGYRWLIRKVRAAPGQ